MKSWFVSTCRLAAHVCDIGMSRLGIIVMKITFVPDFLRASLILLLDHHEQI